MRDRSIEMSHGGKLTPNLDQQSTKILNLTVLQRIDPCIEEILLTATHVTFYKFNIELNQWSRKDVEGSLFVVKRNAQPRFQFVVMNRRSTDNLVENLLGDFEYEVQVPYLLYRNAAQEVNGIWFYNSRECEDVANLITRILNAYSKVPPKPKVSATNSEFEELEKVPTMAVIDGPLEPASASPTTAALEDLSFINFFSSAMNLGNTASNVNSSGQFYHSLSSAPLSNRVPGASPPAAALQIPSLPVSVSSTPPLPFHDSHYPNNDGHRVTNLVKPSSFVTPPSSFMLNIPQPPFSSSMPTALHAPINLQHQYGSPALQHLPPPAPSPSLTPISPTSPDCGLAISRDKVRDALLMLVQDNQFVEMFYQALLKGHSS